MENVQNSLISPLGENSLDLDKIREAFKEFLKVNNVINDVDYEGSNISILIDLISYTIYGINSTNALLFNESMLPTATIRENIIMLAQTLGYRIQRPISAKLKVKIKAKDTLQAGENIIMPRGTKFQIGDGIVFYNKDDVLLQDNNEKEIEIEEGILLTKDEDDRLFRSITSQTDKFILPYRNIEEDSIRVYIKRKGTNDFIQYNKVKSLIDLETDKNQYFEDYDADSGFVVLRFKFTNLGNTLNQGDEIKVEFALTIGSKGNNLLDVSLTPTTVLSNQNNNIDIELVDYKYPKTTGGADEESNLSIKSNATRYYNAANRLVTEDDYKAFLEMDSIVEIAGAWGGEEMPQIIRGRIYFSAIPQNTSDLFFKDKDIAHLLDILATKRIVSTERNYWHPLYYVFDVKTKIIGNVVDLSDKQKQLKDVFERNYQNNIRQFNANIFYSKIIRDLEAIFASDKNASVEISLNPKIRLYPENFDTLFQLDDQCTNSGFEKDYELSDDLKAMNDKLLISLPILPNEYFLVKGIEKLSASGKDIKSYLLNGWSLVKSTQGFFSLDIKGDKLNKVDYPDIILQNGNHIRRPSDLLYDNNKIGTIDWMRNEVWIDKSFKGVIEGLPEKYYDLVISFGDDCAYPVSSALRRNLFPIIGNIEFV